MREILLFFSLLMPFFVIAQGTDEIKEYLYSQADYKDVCEDNELGQIICQKLFSEATRLSGYESNINPKVYSLVDSLFEQWFCLGKKCRIKAVFIPSDTVVIRRDILKGINKNKLNASIVVHEFVHFLQYSSHAGGYDQTACRQRAKDEEEAYLVQKQFLAGTEFLPMILISCN